MTTHTLADGTEVPTHYDFNQHFKPLPVKNQGQDPTCYRHEHATLCEAALRMWKDKAVTIDPDRMSWVQDGGTRKVWSFPDHPEVGSVVTDYCGDSLWNCEGFEGLSKKEAIIKALWLNGVIEGSVVMQHSYERMWAHPEKYEGYNTRTGKFSHLPILTMLSGDDGSTNGWAHAQPFVGYHWTKGLIPQNSWGHRWGMNGRVYIAWEALDAGAVHNAFALTFGDHPVNSLVMPPRLAA